MLSLWRAQQGQSRWQSRKANPYRNSDKPTNNNRNDISVLRKQHVFTIVKPHSMLFFKAYILYLYSKFYDCLFNLPRICAFFHRVYSCLHLDPSSWLCTKARQFFSLEDIAKKSGQLAAVACHRICKKSQGAKSEYSGQDVMQLENLCPK